VNFAQGFKVATLGLSTALNHNALCVGRLSSAFTTGAYAMVTMSQQVVSAPRAGVAASVHTSELGYASTLVMLSHFKHLMACDGVMVDTQHMLADSHYALAQLALAHTSTSEPLRQCAMRVFALFHA
jgi:hypothetical protein